MITRYDVIMPFRFAQGKKTAQFCVVKAKRKMQMKKFFNIIPGQESCVILLYGYVGEYEPVNSADIIRELYEAENLYKKIDVRINSNGGDVHAGIAIFNALRNSKANITIYIDGIAASIASVIAACGKPVQMSKYAKLMIHRVSGRVWGNPDEIEGYLETMLKVEETLIDIYSERTGKTTEEIKEKYFDGQEHWLSAADALEEKLIDGIYDVEPIPANSTPEQIYTIFQNRIKQPPIKNYTIMFEKLKQRKSFANCADEAAAETVIADLETKAAKADALEAENAALKTENEAYKKREEEAHEAEIKEAVQTARSEERIGADEVEAFENVLRKDFENGKKLLDARKPKRRAMQNLRDDDDPKPSAWDMRMEEIKNNLK